MPPSEPAGPVVSNSGPLIALAGAEQLILLQKLYGELLIAPAVKREVTASRSFALVADQFNQPWVKVSPLRQQVDPLLLLELDAGEAETIALARQIRARRTLIDERKGRRVAETVYHLPVIGTGGVLLAAKKAGHINQVRPLLRAMQAKAYFLSERLVEGICQAAGE